MKKLVLSLCFMLASITSFANVNVCLDKAGKKIFSDVTCEKRGLQVATADFPVVTKDSVQPVYVVTPASASAPDTEGPSNASQASQPAKSEKRASPWSSDIPLPGFAWFFIALMPIAGALFLAFHLALFVKARLRKYRHIRSSMDKQHP